MRVDRGWLSELCSLPGVSGSEQRVRDAVAARLRPLGRRGWVDPLGSLVVHGGREDVPQVLLAAHCDEVGLLVTGHDDAGLLRIDAVGGIDPRILPGAAVRVGPQRIPGGVAMPPIHLVPADRRRRAPDLRDLRLDIGASDRRQAEAAVRIGDVAVFAGPVGPLGRLFRAKALDDRAGLAAVVAALEAVGPDLGLGWTVAATAQEEIGTRGAEAVAAVLDPALVVVVETTSAADLPEIGSERRATVLGGGPALTRLDGGMIADGPLTEHLAETARRAGIPFQWKESGSGGTDGRRFQQAGLRVVTVSVPCRYLHTPCGVMDPADADAVADLLATWLRRLAEEGIAR